ncbi:hypothetical protein MLGJGCBP_06702 [Rhodococcus sp. T7]|nr:hypothetical protein MLGJGCBP_06702 [Rhodococcus sp. T7]
MRTSELWRDRRREVTDGYNQLIPIYDHRSNIFRNMDTDLFFSPAGDTRQARRYREEFAFRGRGRLGGAT